jgi:hypothetical protein
MRLDDTCAKPGCGMTLTPGMYAYQVGCLLYCQGCVSKVLLVPDNVIPMQRQSREYGTHSSEKPSPVLSDPA